jgi:glucokinase
VSIPVIGIDLGTAKVSVAPLRDREFGESLVQPTERSDAAALIDELVAMVEHARTDDLIAVGIGVPQIVDFETGRLVSSTRPASPSTNGAVDLPLADIPLRQVLGDRLGVRVFVDNDTTAAALAEAHDEDLELVVRHLVLLTVGTSVGGGLVLDGRIYRGATGAAGELGHTILGLDLAGAVPAPLGFPQPGSLEFVAASHAFDRLAAVAGNVHPKSALARLRAQGKPVLSADVVDAALDGDESAARMIEIWGQRVGIGIANAIHTFDPQEVVIGSDAARADELLLEPARRVALSYVLPGLGTHTTIRLARHGVRAGVLGAALLARYEMEPSA